MTVGLSGTYAFNAVDFSLPPTSGRWVKRDSLGIDGAGHPIYPLVRDFELSWSLVYPADIKYITDTYNAVSNTGTVVVDLPEYGAPNSDYRFKRYSGCIVHEHEQGEYFQEHSSDVRLLITNIRI